jgi:hypothetical protein
MKGNHMKKSVEGKIKQAVAAVASTMYADISAKDRAEILGEVDFGTIENVIAGQLALGNEALGLDEEADDEDEDEDEDEDKD